MPDARYQVPGNPVRASLTNGGSLLASLDRLLSDWTLTESGVLVSRHGTNTQAFNSSQIYLFMNFLIEFLYLLKPPNTFL